jgi:predicted Co/Zn/Cd cation transporter (cation efflux family)
MSAPLSFHLGKMVIIAGIALVVIGVLLMVGSRFGLGRLPGDITYKGKNVTFYFPIVTCLVLSVVVTLVFWLVSFLSRR